MTAPRYNTDGSLYPSAAPVSRGNAALDPEGISRRIVELERSKAPLWAEYDVAYTTSGTTIVLNHNLGPSVRWYVVGWRLASDAMGLTDGFYRVWEASQEPGILTLATHASQVAGGIVTFRLEQIQ